MKYPIVVLKQKYEQLNLDLERIEESLNGEEPEVEMSLAIIRINKYQNDLYDAINTLTQLSSIDENYVSPKLKADLIREGHKED